MSREQRQEAQRRSTEVRNAKRADLATRTRIIGQLVDWSDRESLSIRALEATLTMIDRATGAVDGITIETALDVERIANAAKTMHSLMRLELGESTSNVATAAVDPEILAARLAKVTDSRPTST